MAFSAVGSLREEIRPGDIIVPDQIIDRTKVGRAWTPVRLTELTSNDAGRPPLDLL